MGKGNGLLGNLAWKFAERISAQLISTIVSIILARLLEPEHYGVISIVMIFITLANVLVSDGFGSALIQKKDATELDFFSVLYFNIGFSVLMYIALFFSAPFISDFYGGDYPELTLVLRVLGVRIIFTSVNSVQQAYVSKKMMFRKFFQVTLWGTISSAAIGIAMACAGFGVWALVAQYLSSTIISTLTLAVALKKRLKWMFSMSSIKKLLPFGARILGAGLLVTGYQELRALIIGKIYSSSDLAYYDKGRQFPKLVVTNINSSIGAVLFPKMSNEQENREKIQQTTRNAIRFSSYIMCPVMLGLASVAEPFVRVILTEKWLDCVPLLKMFCIVYLFHPIHTANMQAIKAIGRGDIYFNLEVFKKIIELVVLLITMWFGVEAIVIGMTICATAFTFVNAYPNARLLGYRFKEQMADILPNIGLALVMCLCVWLVGLVPLNDFVMLVAQILVGAFVYVLLSEVFKKQEYQYMKQLIISYFRKK